MQHTLNSICMTGWVFFLPREAFYKVCQVAAVRAKVAFPSVMLTAAVPAQAEWNGNDIMFIQERRSQAQISVSKILGCKERTLARDHQSVRLLSCCTHNASSHKHLTHQREPCMLHPLTFITWRLPHVRHPSHTYQHEPHTPHVHITHIHTVHTTPSHIQHSRASIYTTSLAQTHINTSHTPSAYTIHSNTAHNTSPHTQHPQASTHTACPPYLMHTQIHTHESYISHNSPLHKHTM